MNIDYTMIAEARGHIVLWYRQFGSYQGNWLLLSRDDDLYYLWNGYYGSCGGCDAIESEFGYSDRDDLTPDHPKVQEFIADYHPFIEMRRDAALRVAKRGSLFSLPRNRREYMDEEWNNEAIGHQLALVVKAQEGAISASEILELDNQEMRRETIERYGAERFVADVEAVRIDQEGENELYHLPNGTEPFAFLYVKDPSTERRYVLRVSPEHKTARAARAASFGFTEKNFVLVQET